MNESIGLLERKLSKQRVVRGCAAAVEPFSSVRHSTVRHGTVGHGTVRHGTVRQSEACLVVVCQSER